MLNEQLILGVRREIQWISAWRGRGERGAVKLCWWQWLRYQSSTLQANPPVSLGRCALRGAEVARGSSQLWNIYHSCLAVHSRSPQPRAVTLKTFCHSPDVRRPREGGTHTVALLYAVPSTNSTPGPVSTNPWNFERESTSVCNNSASYPRRSGNNEYRPSAWVRRRGSFHLWINVLGKTVIRR